MAVDANILLQQRGIDLAPAVDAFNRSKQQRIQNERQAAQDQLNNQLLNLQMQGIEQQQQARQQEQVIKDGGFLGSTILGHLNNGQPDLAAQFLQSQMPYLTGASKQMAQEALDMIGTNDPNELERLKQLSGIAVNSAQQFGLMQQSQGAQKSLEQKSFEELLALAQDPNASEVERNAALVKLRIKAPATGSAAQTIAEEGKTEVIAESREAIIEAERTGAERGARRQKDIGKISDVVAGIDRGLSNAKRAIEQIDKGAKTGKIQNLLPSINSATLELQQILGEETLNRLSQVTLGAISESELDLLKQVALPVGMDEKELKKYLERKSEALKKARKVAVEQLKFLRDGGTVEEFIISKSGQQPQQEQSNTVGRFKIISVQ